MTNAPEIAHFFTVVAEAKKEAEAARPFHARLVLLSLLDVLSHAAHPSIVANRARFVTFVDDYTQWSLSSTFSLRQLHLRLSEPSAPSSIPGFSPLLAEVERRMHAFPSPGTAVFPAGIDPSLDQLRTFLNPQLAKYIEPVRYPSLLWSLRNSVVHELRNLGEGFDFELGKASPYYHRNLHVDGVT
ncbi:MAG: hypothetical protein E4G90_09690, partial [Gemmatimonadales bacterium]